jgi:hypothetical protein
MWLVFLSIPSDGIGPGTFLYPLSFGYNAHLLVAYMYITRNIPESTHLNPEDGDRNVLQNGDICSKHYPVAQPRRPHS